MCGIVIKKYQREHLLLNIFLDQIVDTLSCQYGGTKNANRGSIHTLHSLDVKNVKRYVHIIHFNNNHSSKNVTIVNAFL